MSKSVEQFVALRYFKNKQTYQLKQKSAVTTYSITESGRDVAFVSKLVIDSGDINLSYVNLLFLLTRCNTDLYIGEFILHILYSQF